MWHQLFGPSAGFLLFGLQVQLLTLADSILPFRLSVLEMTKRRHSYFGVYPEDVATTADITAVFNAYHYG